VYKNNLKEDYLAVYPADELKLPYNYVDIIRGEAVLREPWPEPDPKINRSKFELLLKL
jgi:hypothetical protein